jgi:hypothetical protein
MKDFKILCHITSAHHAHHTVILYQPIMHTRPSYCISPSCTPHRHIVSAHHAHHTRLLLLHKYRKAIPDIGADNFYYIYGEVTFARQRKAITAIVKKAYRLYFGCKIGTSPRAGVLSHSHTFSHGKK